MKISSILIISSLISIAVGMERQISLLAIEKTCPNQYLNLYKSSIDGTGKIRDHKLYGKRLDYVINKIMKESLVSRNFLIEVRDLYEEGGIFAYEFAKEYFGDLITEDEYNTLTYNDIAHKSFWKRIYRNFSQQSI